MIQIPETRYVQTGDVHVAYQVFGDGPFDLLFVSHPTDPIDLIWDDPLAAAALRRLGAAGRVIMLDMRGAGSSDAIDTRRMPRMEAWVDDLRAVMADAGSTTAAVVAVGESFMPAALLAAAHPESVRALAVVNGYARFERAPDYPAGAPPEVARRIVDDYRSRMGTEATAVLSGPDRVADPAFVRWRGKCERLAGAPATMTPLFDFFLHTDVRGVLDAIQAPTLVLHRRDDIYVRVAHGRFLADRIPNARLVELGGADHYWYSGDVDRLADELIAFLTGAQAPAATSRQLATVLFTDVVGSTERAAALGDRQWAALLETHNDVVARHVAGFGGKIVKFTGDGALATFDGPARAVHCAEGIRGALQASGLQIRAGLHTGEVEMLDEDIGGIAVHVAARIMALAEPGEVLASGVIEPLVFGSGICFESRGSHALKGLDGAWPVVAVVGS
jgi:class 3 adenylate cyclase